MGKKKLFRGLLVSVMLLCTIQVWGYYDFTAVNDEGVTIYYMITSPAIASAEKTCEVRNYREYTFQEVLGGNYTGRVVVPETVTYRGDTYSVRGIGYCAFKECSYLTEVVIPESVTYIDEYSFCHCGITSLSIPNSVTTIGKDVFSSCYNLIFVTIPNSVTSIGDRAFAWCSSLTEIEIPSSVTTIGSRTFYYCEHLTKVTIPDAVTSIGDYAFGYCSSLAEVTIPNSVKSIGDYAFYGCSSLKKITIPNSVTSIGSYAFYKCTSLADIVLSNSMTNIGDYEFYECYKLAEITIPNSITNIGDKAFYNCRGLSNVTSLNVVPPTCRPNSFSGASTSTCILYVPKESIDDYSTAYVWKEFYSIQDVSTSGIETLTPDGAEVVGYYTLDGKVLAAPQRGVNVVRYSDGSVKKVVVEK